MKLLRLHIQGFKSFKDKTVIHFDKGITGIVGPNGCGKSNIVDALFWVMGEQSAKHLRGTKMKDLIFAGSSKYAPATWAEVTLVLLNDGGKHIHIGNEVSKPTEIALTRKLYSNGETEYRINGLPARLKDIQEVFMDTGAGAKSYSIIAQGEIARLVNAKPEERRVMIEEVAGVTKFKLRKRESLKKIESTQANLFRLSDLQDEIYKNLKALEKQSEKAEKAKYLREKVKKHELIVESHREFDFINDYLTAKEFLETKTIDLENYKTRKNQIELDLEDEKTKKEDLMGRVDDLQDEYNEKAKLLAASQERLKHLIKSLADQEKRVIEKKTENEEIEKDIQERSEKALELKSKLDLLIQNNPETANFEEMEERITILKNNLNDKEEEYQLTASKFQEEKKLQEEVDQKIFRNSSKLEEFARTLEDIILEIDDIEKSTSSFTDEIIKQREEVKNLREKSSSLEESLKKYKDDFENKEKQFKETDSELKLVTSNYIKLESKIQSLIEMNKEGEGVKKGALKFLEENDKGSFEVLGNIVECEKEYAMALETLLEDSLNSIISKSDKTTELSSWISNNENESIDYLISNNVSGCTPETLERIKLKGLTDAVSIVDLLHFTNLEFKNTLVNILNGYYVSNLLTPELGFRIAESTSIKGIVSLDGKTFLSRTSNGLKLSVRSPEHKRDGIVSRNNLLNELKVDFENLTHKKSELENVFAQLLNDVEDLKNLVALKSREFSEVNTKYVTLKASLDSRESAFGATNSRLDILHNRKNDISKQRLAFLEEEESLLLQKKNLDQLVSSLEESVVESLSTLQEFRASYEAEREDFLALQANAKTYTSQVDSLKSQINDIEIMTRRFEEKIENNNIAISTLEEDAALNLNNLNSLEESNATNQDELSLREDDLNVIKDELSSLLVGMQERENEVKDLTSKINKIEKDSVEYNLKMEQIIADEEILVRDIFERFKVDLRKIILNNLNVEENKIGDLKDISSMYFMESEDGTTEIEASEYFFEKRFPAAVRESREKLKRYKIELQKLGEINWQAIEDYDRQKLRYDFLKTQEEELKKSLNDLEVAISHIDEKSKERFKEAYDLVNERFSKVFPIIFGGGEARLEIVGDINSLDSGIDIIAKPPGKKMQSITLMSGGEKAMTAVSLIFSIFLVKPSPFCLLDEVDAPLDDANVGRFNELLREMSSESQFILITHNKKTMELNDTLYGVTMQEPGVSKAVSVQLH